jgi:tetratricopeptide (TPR) repeat protein
MDIDTLMPLEEPDLNHLRAAEGYLTLGMYEDANAELDNIDAFNRVVPEVLRLRLEIYRGLNKWELMQVVAAKLAQHDPGTPEWRISYAYAVRRAESLERAKPILLEAIKRFPDEALIHYNLACYDCQLGDLESAKGHLKTAFQIEPKWRSVALDDEDLGPLWAELAHPD